MRWVGEGSDLWRVRVDLLAESPARVRTASEAMLRQLPFDDGEAGVGGGVAADQAAASRVARSWVLRSGCAPTTSRRPLGRQSRSLAAPESKAESAPSSTTLL